MAWLSPDNNAIFSDFVENGRNAIVSELSQTGCNDVEVEAVACCKHAQIVLKSQNSGPSPPRKNEAKVDVALWTGFTACMRAKKKHRFVTNALFIDDFQKFSNQSESFSSSHERMSFPFLCHSSAKDLVAIL